MLQNIVASTLRMAHLQARSLLNGQITAGVTVGQKYDKYRRVEMDHRRHFRSGFVCCIRDHDRKIMMKTMVRKDEGTAGEVAVDIDSNIRGVSRMFPDETTPDLLFGGVRFDDLPVLSVHASKNNTCMTFSDEGKIKFAWSCGREGFKTARKGTNIAAQAAAITIGKKAVECGYSNVRVTVKGLGPGRMSSMKGFTMGGLNVVSISDNTSINWYNNPRPKKRRRV